MLKQLRPLLLAGIMTASASAASAGDPGITDTGIKLGTQAPMSGPVAMIGSVAEGLDLKFKAVNAQGGVKMGDGKTRKIDLVVMDDANEPPRTVTNARRMVEQLGVFAFVGAVGTPQNQAIKSYIAQKQVPDLFIYSGIYEWGDEKQNPWGTMLVPSFTTESAIYAKYLDKPNPTPRSRFSISTRTSAPTSSTDSKPPSRGPRSALSRLNRPPTRTRPSTRR